MKRKLFIILLFLSPIVLQAQWRIGVSGGADYNKYSINTNYQVDFRYEGAWGWSAGVFGQYNFLDWVGIRAELEATERNYRFHRTGVWAGTNYVLHNTYLQLPVMAQFSFGGQDLQGFVNVGCYAGYWLIGKYQGTVVDMINDTTVAINEPYIFQNEKDQHWDFGLAGGLGIKYRFLEHWEMFVDSRYYYSLISTVKQYQQIKDYRYNTTLGIKAGFSYIF